jgi:hypothetical protein
MGKNVFFVDFLQATEEKNYIWIRIRNPGVWIRGSVSKPYDSGTN